MLNITGMLGLSVHFEPRIERILQILLELSIHFLTAKYAKLTKDWVDACGAGQNLQNEQNFFWVDHSISNHGRLGYRSYGS